MSYKTPIVASLTLKGIDSKIQSIASHMPSTATGGLSWLTHAFGLADRMVEFRDGKEFVYPAVFQDINSKDQHSCMPNDIPDAFCFWVKEDMKISNNNPARSYYKISCIFFMDLRQIDPLTNFKITKTKIRQDILEFFRVHHYSGFGVITPAGIIDDDITQVYKGFSVNQLDNIVRQLPKYALRFNFDFAFINECSTNIYGLGGAPTGLIIEEI
jgi:hypothetical protein